MSKTIVWSKNGCPFCDRAVQLLNAKGIDHEVRTIGEGWTKEQMLESVPSARTVPQIIIDDASIGGFTELHQLLTKGGN
jgi:glutaredoxin 3